LKTIGTLLAILVLTIFIQIQGFAQDFASLEKDDEQTQEELAARRQNTRRLEGVWDVQVTRFNCQTGTVIATVPAMLTYARGGTMSDWGTGNPPALRSPGQGVWSFVSRNHYASAFQFFRFNADGTLAGKQIVRSRIVLSNDGNSHTISTTAQVLDVNGNVIANNCSTATATRFE
jgi:hypothetical protein